MVISKIFGGLGNQMFQYAFGRHLALKNNQELKLDLSFFEYDGFRRYSLNHFSITENIAGPEDIELLKHKQNSRRHQLAIKLFNSKPYFIHEQGLNFNPQYFTTQSNVYIDGYWQSGQYFSGSSTRIREDFQFKTPASEANKTMLSAIGADNSVSLHIRRGDFSSDRALNNIHGTCPIAYYQKASALITGKIKDPVFYIFSDDLAWAEQHLKLDYKMRLVDINDDETAYEDLRLMANCKHHIIANSTFSWWGAWLNANTDKIVIAPAQWFIDPVLNEQAQSIIPKSWIKI